MTHTILPPGIQYKSVETQARTPDVNDLGNGIIEAIVSITGMKDNVDDVILPGAYEKSLVKRTPKGVWHHSWTDPIAKTHEIKELRPGDPLLPDALPDGSPWPSGAGALYVKMEFNLKTDKGRNAYEDVKFFGDSQEWSIGYKVPEKKAYRRNGIRYITELDLYEYSPVLFGAMSSARTTTVKDAQLAYKSLNTDTSNTTRRTSLKESKMNTMTELKAQMSVFADAFYNVVGLMGDLAQEMKDDTRHDVLDLVDELGLDADDFEEFYDEVDSENLEGAQEKALAIASSLESKGGDDAVKLMEHIAVELKTVEEEEDEDWDDEEEEEDWEEDEEDEEDEEEDEEKSFLSDTEVKSIPLAEISDYLN